MGPGRRPVQLVRHQHVGEDGAWAEYGFPSIPIQDHCAGHVCGQQVSGELHPVEVESQRTGERLGQRGLAQAGEVLHQQVALGEEAPDSELHRVVVRVEDALYRLDDPGIEDAELLGSLGHQRDSFSGPSVSVLPGGGHRPLTTGPRAFACTGQRIGVCSSRGGSIRWTDLENWRSSTVRGGVDRCAGWPKGHSSRMARSLYRSVTYGLEASLALAQTVAQSGGRSDAATVASALSYSGVRNGAFLSRLANARLFGLVAGRSGQVVLTDRGRRCLSADPAVQMAALAEACWAVPLFHRVLEEASGEELGDVDGLATVLETRFGEDSSKSRTTARVLLESAGRAGLLRAGRVDLSLVRGSITNFTDSDPDPGHAFAPSVRLRWNPHVRRVKRHSQLRADKGGATMDDGTSAPDAEQPSDEGDLWIDEGTGSPQSRTNRRRTGIVLGVAACVALIGVPVGLLAASGPEPVPQASAASSRHGE